MCVQKREHVDGWRDEQICSLKLLRTSSPVLVVAVSLEAKVDGLDWLPLHTSECRQVINNCNLYPPPIYTTASNENKYKYAWNNWKS